MDNPFKNMAVSNSLELGLWRLSPLFLLKPVFEPLKGDDDVFVFAFGKFFKLVIGDYMKEQPGPTNFN